MTKKQAGLLEYLEARGFDRSHPSGARGVTVACSQCEALAINGVACHERGCPNTTYECLECGTGRVSRPRATCEDCQTAAFGSGDDCQSED